MPESKGGRRVRRLGRFRKKACHFCVTPEISVDYKQAEILRPYIRERGKISPRRSSGLCAMHQRQMARAVKRARQMSLIAYDNR